jgi:hypothetical protein
VGEQVEVRVAKLPSYSYYLVGGRAKLYRTLPGLFSVNCHRPDVVPTGSPIKSMFFHAIYVDLRT